MCKLILTEAGFKYGNHMVLSSINFETYPGEFIGIVGPNGSGKSTLLRGMANLLHPYTGCVMLDGMNIKKRSLSFIARRIAFVPQYATLPDLFSVIDIVLMGRTPHLGLLRYESTRDINIAIKAMEATHTAYLANKRINELSGGERQRVLIARALAQEATILLLDEPTANLDINFQAEVLNFLRKLCSEKKMTVVAAIHDLNLASQYSSRIIMLKDGKIFRQGKPQEVIDRPSIMAAFGINIHVYQHPFNGLPITLVSPPDMPDVKK